MDEEVIPILRVEDAAAAVTWYERLGFAKQWEHRFERGLPAFVEVARGGVRLFLSEHKGDNPGPTMCHVEVDDLDALMAEWKERRPDFTQSIEIAPWNAKHVSLKDPFGNRLGINENLPESSE